MYLCSRKCTQLHYFLLIFMAPVFTSFSLSSITFYNTSGSKYLPSHSSCRGSIGGARPRPAGISTGLSTYRLCSEMVRIGGGASWQRPTRGMQGCCSGHLQSDSGHWTPDRLEPHHPSGGTDRAELCSAAILLAV